MSDSLLEKYKHLKLERRGRILVVTINNPPMNQFLEEMHREFTHIFTDLNHDDKTAVVVLTGAGDRAFSAGGNIDQMKRRVDNHEIQSMTAGLHEARMILRGFLNLKKPIIARINGHAMGLGATLALFCDVTFMVKKAKIGDTHVKVGLSAGDGGALLWPLLIGYPKAKELLLTGRVLTGEEAAAIGLVNYAVEDHAELDAKVFALAEELANGASQAINATKISINLLLRHHLDALMEAHGGMELETWGSDDHKEAVYAFKEKREPKFTGK